MLKDEGYANGLFGKWHLGGETKMGGATLGYSPIHFDWDYFYGALGGGVTSYSSWSKIEEDTSGVLFDGKVTDYPTTVNKDDAMAWIKAQPASQPWMATVVFNAPHDPWDGFAPSVYRTRTDINSRAIYRSMLENMDLAIAELLAGIPTNVLEQTTIIFMGDNGTPVDTNVKPPTPISEHFTDTKKVKDSLYQGGINVPLIVADDYAYLHPGEESPWTKGKGRVVSPNRVETALVQTLDIFATCAGIARGDTGTLVDSVSLIPYLQSASATPQRETVFAETRPKNWEPDQTWTCGDSEWDVAVAIDRIFLY